MQEGACPRREACPYAHNVFEYWLHPTRYRTQLCNDDNRCKRRICFFAHTLEELRVPSCKPFVPPEALAAATPPEAMAEASGSPPEWSQHLGGPKVGHLFQAHSSLCGHCRDLRPHVVEQFPAYTEGSLSDVKYKTPEALTSTMSGGPLAW